MTSEGKSGLRTTISRHEEIRRRCGYTITALAHAIGFSRAYVSRVEGGTLKGSPRYRETVSKVLRVPQALIFDDEGGDA